MSAKKTCVEMLEQRNYKINTEEETNIIATKPDGSKVMVFFSDAAKFNVKNIQTYISEMNNLSIFHGIVVYKDGITSFTKKAITKSPDMKIELFPERDLRYNITKHRLQPRFQQLSPSESEEFKKQYGIKYGIIKIDDPIARFYDYNKGDVIRVIRKKGECDFITYRIVR